ncbi:putative HTH-type transcriptional regulator YvaP [Sphaerisporangium melleum]|uniref:HTH-type transcriptional regulator YvaP n=1 Tax=Sphaerisporangium melleum TaxID=321316 RepID=A0A917VDD2_9ACTN|nr:helix-turn-helix domain-containing protein [Sphaerisporangium melleum]GGK66503.1 putative HTH-type transcriptional regulator YvaP [Sphaerisporangium melleum]GII68589.1 putative HTH-type transcriptional regulator YvaP [Sphaerisporangium melleum]
MSTYEPDFCPRYHQAVEMIGRRWAGVILRELLRGATHFRQISAAIPDITDKLLSERLKRFESEGVVERTVLPTTPVTIEYRLTDKGRALEAAVREISSWAETWLPAEGEPDTVQLARSGSPAEA